MSTSVELVYELYSNIRYFIRKVQNYVIFKIFRSKYYTPIFFLRTIKAVLPQGKTALKINNTLS